MPKTFTEPTYLGYLQFRVSLPEPKKNAFKKYAEQFSMSEAKMYQLLISKSGEEKLIKK